MSLRSALPALVFMGLIQATSPALASGLRPVCTATGLSWVDETGQPVRSDGSGACAHGWCKPRRGKLPHPGMLPAA